MSDPPASAPNDRVECPASKDPAVRLFILAGMMLVFGLWCFWDAFVGGKYPYPDDGNINQVMKHYFNHGGGIILPLGGLIPLVWGILALRRRLVADAEGIGYVGKDRVAWQSVTRLDATLLQEKGILKLHHGAGRPLALDSWKLQNFKALVAFIESHVSDEARETPEPPAAETPFEADDEAGDQGEPPAAGSDAADQADDD